MLAWLAIATAHAAPSLSLGSAIAVPGDTITIPVSFTNDSAGAVP